MSPASSAWCVPPPDRPLVVVPRARSSRRVRSSSPGCSNFPSPRDLSESAPPSFAPPSFAPGAKKLRRLEINDDRGDTPPEHHTG
eukprot:31464-Pelagococcus_subviridis.AAC.1